MFKFCPFCGVEIGKQANGGFQCQNCKKKYYYGSKPTASVVPICKDKVLLAVRAVEPAKGELDLIGGFLENGEDPLEGAVRETLEETEYKVNPDDLKFLGIWVGEYEYQGDTFSTFNVIYTVNFEEELELSAKDDVASLKWIPINGDYEFAFEPMYHVFEKLKSL